MSLSRSVTTLLTGLYGLIIVIISFCLSTRAFTNFDLNIILEVFSSHYLINYHDIYFLIVFDTFLFIGLPIVCLFKRISTKKKLQRIRLSLILLQLCFYGYTIVKFLIFYEWTNVKNTTSPRELDRFDILSIIFLPIIFLSGIFVWIFYFRCFQSTETNENRDPERQPLLNSNTKNSVSNEESSETAQSENIEISIKQSKGSWWRIIKVGREEWFLYLIAFVFLLIAAMGDVFQPLYSGKIISAVVANDWNLFLKDVFTYLGIAIAYVVASGLRGFIFSITSTNLIQRLRNRLFAAIMKQEVAFFDSTKTGDLTSRLSSDITTVGQAVSVNLNIFLRSAVQAIGTITMMLILSWNLFLLALITGPLAFGTTKLYGDLMAKEQTKIQDALASANSLAEEAISTVRTVKSFANEDEEIDLFAKKNEIIRKHSIRQAFYYFGYLWNAQILTVLLNLGTLAYGGHLVLNNRLTVSNFISFILYQQRLGDTFDTINNVYTDLMKASGASVKLFEYIDRVPKVIHDGTKKPSNFLGRIEFRNVSFSFPNRKNDPVLKNVSFTVEPGQQVALVGPSGSGKTTCIGLLEYFYEPNQGEILVDDVPIQEYDYKYYHEKVSIVNQEPVLHARSIRDNIQYGLIEKKPDETMELVSEMADARSFISLFRLGYETECGERGIQLSGGQKQRIALARALIRSPSILLLDEATSALDAEAEAQVQDAIARTVVGRTVLIVAHRLSTIRHADKIIVMQNGQIIEEGVHAELMTKMGLYYQLVKRQTEHYQAENQFPSTNTILNQTRSIDLPSKEEIYSTSFGSKQSV